MKRPSTMTVLSDGVEFLDPGFYGGAVDTTDQAKSEQLCCFPGEPTSHGVVCLAVNVSDPLHGFT